MQHAKLLKFTRSGHTVHFTHDGYSGCTQSGYESPESFVKPYHWWADPADKLSTHFEKFEFPAEGIPVLDIRAAVETPAGYRMVVNGPMVSADSDDVQPCPEPSVLFAGALAESSNEFATLLGMQTVSRSRKQQYGPLDYVPVGEYVRLWREAGAKIGRCHVRDGVCTIEWE